MTTWYQQIGVDGDVVISTRIRLARNLRQLPFPATMTEQQKQAVVDRVVEALPHGEGQAFTHRRMNDTPSVEALSLVERHLISPEFSRCGEGEALLLQPNEGVSIMVNE